MEKEIRTQALAKTDSNTVEGYALNWNEYDMGAFVERIDPNALGDLAAYDVHALYNHNYDAVLARSKVRRGNPSPGAGRGRFEVPLRPTRYPDR
jgi:phage head maturation protease